MRTMIVLLVQACLATTVFAEPPKPLEADSLLNWLKILDRDDYRLLHASDQNGIYFAVKIDLERNVVFCVHDQAKPATGTGSIQITDPKSNSILIDPEAKSKDLDPVTVTYVKQTQLDSVLVSTAVNVSHPAGSIFKLRDADMESIRIQYSRENKDRRRETVFDQIVQLPKKSSTLSRPKPSDGK